MQGKICAEPLGLTLVVHVTSVLSLVGGNTLASPNGETLTLRHFANCRMQGVVYLIKVPMWGLLKYIGKTRQQLGKWIEKHMHSMKMGNLYLPL